VKGSAIGEYVDVFAERLVAGVPDWADDTSLDDVTEPDGVGGIVSMSWVTSRLANLVSFGASSFGTM
jgi:hypothetical protein